MIVNSRPSYSMQSSGSILLQKLFQLFFLSLKSMKKVKTLEKILLRTLMEHLAFQDTLTHFALQAWA
jgi:hypothetical protein